MINILKETDRHFSDMRWLQTYCLFLQHYYDPGNIRHGRERVFNDDIFYPVINNQPVHDHYQ